MLAPFHLLPDAASDTADADKFERRPHRVKHWSKMQSERISDKYREDKGERKRKEQEHDARPDRVRLPILQHLLFEVIHIDDTIHAADESARKVNTRCIRS